MDIKKLPYPMFKITLTEAVILTDAAKLLNGSDPRSQYLCVAVDRVTYRLCLSAKTAIALKAKISRAMEFWASLATYFSRHGVELGDNNYQARRIWIKKLLAHNGY
jgi:hypothetical protein